MTLLKPALYSVVFVFVVLKFSAPKIFINYCQEHKQTFLLFRW